jgi:hypothetical protein
LVGQQNLEKLSYNLAPNNAPTPAVSAMASAPQKVTRTIDFHKGAPPTRAATPPSKARNKSELPETTQTSEEIGTIKISNNGNNAPTVNVPADAMAA